MTNHALTPLHWARPRQKQKRVRSAPSGCALKRERFLLFRPKYDLAECFVALEQAVKRL